MLIVSPAMSSDRMPNGTASGSVSRIVIGCRNDSNCAASTMYMKMNDSEIARMNEFAVRASSADWPAGSAT